MKDAIEQFRTQLGAAIDRWNLLEGHSTDKYTKPTVEKALPNLFLAEGGHRRQT